jgi:two-component system NtrC family sensor kinase
MDQTRSPQAEEMGGGQGNYWELSRRLFSHAALGKPIRDFLSDVGQDLLALIPCDGVEVWTRHRQDELRMVCGIGDVPPCEFLLPTPIPSGRSGLEALCRDLVDDQLGVLVPPLSLNGSLIVEDCTHPVRLEREGISHVFDLSGTSGSLVFLPSGSHFEDAKNRQLVVLKWSHARGFPAPEIRLLAEVARTLAQAVGVRRVNASLRERMKELTCLHEIALLKEDPSGSHEESLRGIIDILPGAWLYPESAWSRLTLGEASFEAGARPGEGPSLHAPIRVRGVRRGSLEVGYASPKPPLEAGPFLQEEQELLETVALEIALILERKEVAEESRNLQEQLRHAERLATVGEMAAGIAHELNNPLNNILGFAQLIEEVQELPVRTRRDVSMVVNSALHARDVIRQLLLFSRRRLQTGILLDLGHLVEEALTFLGAICAKADVELQTHLDPDVPPIWANPDELRQVLVNLVVNASQATAEGGTITILTDQPEGEDAIVRLTVEDTGAGMDDEAIGKAFLPFFTTRDEGTGLGLSVVHGIVTSHKGSIRLESEIGKGTSFEIRFPVTST